MTDEDYGDNLVRKVLENRPQNGSNKGRSCRNTRSRPSKERWINNKGLFKGLGNYLDIDRSSLIADDGGFTGSTYDRQLRPYFAFPDPIRRF